MNDTNFDLNQEFNHDIFKLERSGSIVSFFENKFPFISEGLKNESTFFEHLYPYVIYYFNNYRTYLTDGYPSLISYNKAFADTAALLEENFTPLEDTQQATQTIGSDDDLFDLDKHHFIDSTQMN